MATLDANLATERHYSPAEVAEMWNVSAETVRRMFEDCEGVLRIANPRRPGRRKRVTLRISQSALDRLHQQRSAGFLSEVKARRRKVGE